jgi:hypothetical protein
MYAVVLKHRYAKEWDLDRIETMTIFNDESQAKTSLIESNAQSIAKNGEEIYEIKEIKAQ